MYCAACAETTAVDPCDRCGAVALLAGKWRLDAIIGSGTAGTTWRASAPGGRPWAIKEMPLRLAESDKARELIAREARVLRELHHPGIPEYLEHFVAGKGRSRAVYLVEEYINGPTLAVEMQRRRYTEDEVLGIVEELLWILGYLHDLSPPVIHRDIKPGNVMRRASGELVLVDFGSVRDALQGELGGNTFTGTFGYMAPEQLCGDACPASDLYGAGALAIALLTRQEPHTLLDPRHRLRWEHLARIRPTTGALLSSLVEPEILKRPRSARAALARVTAWRNELRRIEAIEETVTPIPSIRGPRVNVSPAWVPTIPVATMRVASPARPSLEVEAPNQPLIQVPPSNVGNAAVVEMETVLFGLVMLGANMGVILLLGFGTVFFAWRAAVADPGPPVAGVMAEAHSTGE